MDQPEEKLIFHTLITTQQLNVHLHNPDWVIIDCRFDLDNTAWGKNQYLAGHIPGAVYAHLNNDLSGKVTAHTGRHPLPEPGVLQKHFSDWGIGADTQVIVYDEANGSTASRLWWLLRYHGHLRVALLDGGIQDWLKARYGLRSGEEQNIPAVFKGELHPEMIADLAIVDRARLDPSWLVIDARASERHLGIVELIDPVAGHIPGSINYYYGDNLGPGNRYRPAEDLRKEMITLISDRQLDHVIIYCGSGVSACSNLLALEHAELPGARLYPGSWSEWIRDPLNPIATDE